MRAVPALVGTHCSPGCRPPASALSLRRAPRAVQASDDCRWFLLTASLTAMVGSGLLGALLASRPGRRSSVRLMYVLAASPLVLGIQVGEWLGCCVQGPCAVLAFITANHRRRKAAGLGGCLWPPGPPHLTNLPEGMCGSSTLRTASCGIPCMAHSMTSHGAYMHYMRYVMLLLCRSSSFWSMAVPWDSTLQAPSSVRSSSCELGDSLVVAQRSEGAQLAIPACLPAVARAPSTYARGVPYRLNLGRSSLKVGSMSGLTVNHHTHVPAPTPLPALRRSRACSRCTLCQHGRHLHS